MRRPPAARETSFLSDLIFPLTVKTVDFIYFSRSEGLKIFSNIVSYLFIFIHQCLMLKLFLSLSFIFGLAENLNNGRKSIP